MTRESSPKAYGRLTRENVLAYLERMKAHERFKVEERMTRIQALSAAELLALSKTLRAIAKFGHRPVHSESDLRRVHELSAELRLRLYPRPPGTGE